MRITCPNCSSQYEVAEDAIPAAGRDVQCAKCSQIWFQEGAEAPMVLGAEPVAESPAEEAQPAFRSARSDRAEEPAAAPEASAPAPEPAAEAELPPTSLTDDIKRILQEERDFSETAPEAPSAEPTPEAPAEPAVAGDDLSLGAAPRMFEEAQPEAPAEPPAAPAPAQTLEPEPIPEAPTEAETLTAAKSLREVLDAEANQPAAPAADPAQPGAATVQEPTLSDLGLRRPASVTPEPAAEGQPAEARTREAFTNIDDLNSKLDRQTQEPALGDAATLDLGADAPPETSAFSMGFVAACIICITATLLYVMAPRIAGTVPAMAAFAENYTASVDSGRMVLQELYYGGEGEPGFGNLFRNLTGG